MTVLELIAALLKYPMNNEVVIYKGEDGVRYPILDVEISEGDPNDVDLIH